MPSFQMGQDIWYVEFVPPKSRYLRDDTGLIRLGTTDPKKRIIFLSSELEGTLFEKVLMHELAHAMMFSYDLMNDIKHMVRRKHRHDMEEWICNLIADYSPVVNYIFEELTTIY